MGDVKRRWRHLKRLDISEQKHVNCIRVHRGETPSHRNKKIELCLELLDGGRDFVTEARNRDRSRRYDIYLLDSGDVWEIETDEGVEKSDADFVFYV